MSGDEGGCGRPRICDAVLSEHPSTHRKCHQQARLDGQDVVVTMTERFPAEDERNIVVIEGDAEYLVGSLASGSMYALPYTASDVEPRHYKLEWLSLLGAVAAALALLVVAYFINNQDGLQKVAFICIVVAGFTVALCLAALFAHYYVARHNPKRNRDDPPKYKDAWGRDYYSRRISELQDPEDNVSSVSSTLLPHSILQLQCDLPRNESALRLGSLSQVRSSIPELTPHSLQSAAASSSPSSSTCQSQLVTCSATICPSRYCDESQEIVDELPSYDEAMQSMDLSSIEKLKHDIEVEGD